MFLTSGTEYQLPGMQSTYHEGDDLEDFISSTSSRIRAAFEGESQYKVIKAVHRRTNNYKLLSFPTSLDPVVLSALENWIKDKVKTEYAPVIFDFHLFLTSEEPKL